QQSLASINRLICASPRTAKHLPDNSFALFLPRVARRFPFSAPLRTFDEVFLRCGGGEIGEFANDNQSQRALGVDGRNESVRVFGGRIVHGGGYRGRQFEF